MAATSVSGSSAVSSGWGQLQQLNAQRVAEQAEQRARALQSQARQAQGEADQAAERARSLGVAASQADGEASSARQSVLALNSLGKVQGQLSDLRQQVAEVLQPAAASTGGAAPVLNALGQQTGTLISVTA